jgi:hypothetical protein
MNENDQFLILPSRNKMLLLGRINGGISIL